MSIESVGLVGFGRFGRMAYQYLRLSRQVRVYDQDPERVVGVREATSLEETLASRLILLAIPISSVEEFCRTHGPRLTAGQIVADTCSVKQRPVEWMLRYLPERVHILGAHPLFGPDSGKDGIAGLKIAVCPVRIDVHVYQDIRRYLESLGLVVIEATPEEHDRQMARTQVVFHLIAQTMKRLGWGGGPISTPGPEIFYQLVKTVQNDTDQLFIDLQRRNPFAAECRRQFIDTMVAIDRELTRRNQDG